MTIVSTDLQMILVLLQIYAAILNLKANRH